MRARNSSCYLLVQNSIMMNTWMLFNNCWHLWPFDFRQALWKTRQYSSTSVCHHHRNKQNHHRQTGTVKNNAVQSNITGTVKNNAEQSNICCQLICKQNPTDWSADLGHMMIWTSVKPEQTHFICTIWGWYKNNFLIQLTRQTCQQPAGGGSDFSPPRREKQGSRAATVQRHPAKQPNQIQALLVVCCWQDLPYNSVSLQANGKNFSKILFAKCCWQDL